MLDDRDYMRPDQRSRDPFWGGGTWSPVKIVLAANVVVFVLQHFFQVEFMVDRYPRGQYQPAGAFSLQALLEGRVWTLFTHMFVHSGFEGKGLGLLHLLGNMVVIYFAGRRVQEQLGNRNFWIIFFGGGFVGALLQVFLMWEMPLIGASGGAFALLLAFTSLVPEAELIVFIPLPVRLRARTLGRAAIIISVVLSVIGLVSDAESMLGVLGRTANLAHLGGALFGLFYVRRLGFRDGSYTRDEMLRDRARNDLGRRGGAGGRGGIMGALLGKRGPTKRGRKVIDAKVVEIRPGVSRENPVVPPDTDSVLEKLGTQGYASLTKEEIKVLERASEAIRARDNKP
ncbi:hypothetical protein BH23VER1_BH23VER1_05560 [soil metagenome]